MANTILAVTVSEKVLEEAFGPPHRRTDKVLEWRLAEDFGVVLQLDSPKGKSCAYLWTPGLKDADVPSVEYERYSTDRGRHGNTHPCPGLEEGKAAMRFSIQSRADIRKIVEVLKCSRALGGAVRASQNATT